MQRRLIGIVGVVGLFALGGCASQPLLELKTGNMFASQDDDTYDPGLAVGYPLPAMRALYDGHEITGVDEFAGTKGLALFVVRSVDW
jgi:hypothetical protein